MFYLTLRLLFVSILISTIIIPLSALELPLSGPSGEMILGLGELRAEAYSPDGKYIASAGSPLGPFLWDAETGQRVRIFSGDRIGESLCMVFSPDGSKVLTGGGRDLLRLS